MLNAPFGDNVALRGVAYHAREGGYIDNIATGEKDINDIGVTGGRATLTAELVPGWFVDLAGVAQRIEGDDSQYADDEGSGLTRDSLVDQPFSSDFSPAWSSAKTAARSASARRPVPAGRTWTRISTRLPATDPPARAAQQGKGGQQRDARVAADGRRLRLAGRVRSSSIAMR